MPWSTFQLLSTFDLLIVSLITTLFASLYTLYIYSSCLLSAMTFPQGLHILNTNSFSTFGSNNLSTPLLTIGH